MKSGGRRRLKLSPTLRGGTHVREDPSRGRAVERWRGLRGGPHRRLQDALEGGRFLDAVEVQRDVDVLVVVDGLAHALRAYPGLPPGLLEPCEGTQPGLQVSDRMLDVQCGHCLPPFDQRSDDTPSRDECPNIRTETARYTKALSTFPLVQAAQQLAGLRVCENARESPLLREILGAGAPTEPVSAWMAASPRPALAPVAPRDCGGVLCWCRVAHVLAQGSPDA
jgi:hypothetical protein